MYRLAPPNDFAEDLRRISSISEEQKCLHELELLAQTNLDYVQTIQLDRAIKKAGQSQASHTQRTRLAILSSSTVDHLLPALAVAGMRYGLTLDLHASPFAQYRQELMDEDSPLARFAADFVIFSLSARDILASVPLAATDSDVSRIIDEHVNALLALWRVANRKSKATVLQQTFLNVGESIFGSLDRTLPSAPTQVIRQLNDRMVESAKSNGVLILDLDRPIEQDGLAFWFDNARWLNAKIEISPAAATRYADLAARIIAAQRGLSRKCLVLDLDNTLWGGVIGDDGLTNLALGHGTGLGEAYLAFQQYIKRLKDRGIILAVCSKNEEETAKSVFVEHPDMVLGLEDITVFVANWEDKATNLLRIADDLNIGLESLVFVDDNPAERALVRQSLPTVAVPEMSQDPSEYVQCLSEAGYFESVSFTNDDLERNAQYAANQQRKLSEVSSHSIEDYLASLTMSLQYSTFLAIDVPRIAQLINKTNQFNTTTRRRTADEVRAIATATDSISLQIRLSDRFGDNGLISAVIILPSEHADDTYDIDSWVMSCRVFGRQLELEIMNIIVEQVKMTPAKFLTASFIPTKKNGLIKKLYSNVGFEPLPEPDSEFPDTERWVLELGNYESHKTHIARDY